MSVGQGAAATGVKCVLVEILLIDALNDIDFTYEPSIVSTERLTDCNLLTSIGPIRTDGPGNRGQRVIGMNKR